MVVFCFECGNLGGNWGVRIKGRTETPETLTNIYFYVGLEGSGNIHLANESDVPFSWCTV